MKAGPMEHYAYFHQKLVTTKSLAATIDAINSLPPQWHAYRRSTSFEAMATAVRLASAGSAGTQDDQDLADRYRLSIEILLKRAWKRRRTVTKETVDDLDCYTEAAPKLTNGIFDLSPKQCERDRECCLAETLRENKDTLIKLRNAIPEDSTRKEDIERRKVLKQLINTKQTLTREQCCRLGDAIFAFYAPADADILTTNVRDHVPLAEAIGKSVEHP
jgi:hypothetical protein